MTLAECDNNGFRQVNLISIAWTACRRDHRYGADL
jgi:hypothetical protein